MLSPNVTTNHKVHHEELKEQVSWILMFYYEWLEAFNK